MHPFPLTKANRLTIARVYRHHARVDMAIDGVIEGQMGRAFVDDPQQPAVFLLLMSGFFGYLGGDVYHPAAEALVAALPAPLLLMPGMLESSDEWLALVQRQYPQRVMPVDRYRFTGAQMNRDHLARLLRQSPWVERVVRLDETLAGRFYAGTEEMVDLSAYDSATDFVARSLGYCVLEGEDLLGVAYGSLVCSRGIEVSVVVRPDRRRQGLATALSARLLQDCCDLGSAANWDAANPESCKLALKMGYRPVGSYVATFLSK